MKKGLPNHPHWILPFLKKKIGALLILALIFSNIFCQTEVLDGIKVNFEKHSNQFIQEKIFVQTDKAFYTAGEIVWIKLYDVDAASNKPIYLSKVAYVEILNKDQKPILQAKIALRKGGGDGSLFLPLTLHSGVYKIRSYTNWMKNFSADYYFEKDISIVNTLRRLDPIAINNTAKYDVQFFPEGGHLVNGIESKVAFRLTDQTGEGVDCEGLIVNQQNDTILHFYSKKFGIGQFMFTPNNKNQYKAIIKLGNAHALVAELPEIYNSGYTLQLKEIDSNHVKINIQSNLNEEGIPVYLFVHTRQSIRKAELITLSHGMANIIIDKTDLGDGISHFTLFNNLRQPLCERLYFKRPSAKMNIDLDADQIEYGTRKKLNLHIFAQNEKKQALETNLALSVFLEDSLHKVEESDIFSYLWLSSELKGDIESPSYYFSHTDKDADTAMDNLMLTHGWRRFKWEDISNRNTAPSFDFIPEYEGHIITGKVTDKKTGLPIENVGVYLTVPGYRFQLGGAISDKDGKITFDIQHFFDASEVMVQFFNPKDSIYRIDINTPFSDKYSGSKYPEIVLTKSMSGLLASNGLSSQVQNAYLYDSMQKLKLPSEIFDSTAFYGQPNKKYFLDDYTRFTTMEEVLREYVTNILVKNQRGKFHINVMDDSWNQFFKDDPLVLLDGVPILDLNRIFAFDPLKVKKAEVVNRQYFLGPIDVYGIISFTTYKGDLGGFQLDPNTIIIDYEGLQMQREFYSPVYDSPEKQQSRMPDLRTTLYWAPDIKTNLEGRSQLSFYTSDKQGKYIMVVQGISDDGHCGSQILRFDVSK